jgi:parallel beta-helix repeat protein
LRSSQEGLRAIRRLILTLVVALALVAAAPASAQPACGEVITQDTTLTADLDCHDAGNGLVIGAPGITLDLGGHKLNAHNDAITNPGYADVTIRNGSITFDNVGVLLIGATGNTIRDLDIDGLIYGIQLRNSDGNRIVSNELVSSLIQVDSTSDRNVIRDNVTRGREGLIGISGSHNRVVRNVVWAGDTGAMGVSRGHHNEILRNTIVAERATLLALVDADDNLIADNHLVQYSAHFGEAGIRVTRSSRNLFRANRMSDVPVGVAIASGADNVFRRNLVEGQVLPTFIYTEPDGFRVDAAATGTLIQNNQVHGFEDDGIDVEAPGTTVRSNTANDNGDLGIEAVAGVIDGGGNNARGNGNPLQCTGVFCG